MPKTKIPDEPVAQQPLDNVSSEPQQNAAPKTALIEIELDISEKGRIEKELFQLTKQELLAKNLLQQIKDKKKEAEQNYLRLLAQEQINTQKKPAEFQLAFDEFQILCE